jgi:hypothetical protein
MNMKKYVTKSYSDKIEVVEVERETESCVWIHGRRSMKSTEFDCFHDSFDAAKQTLIDRHEVDIRVARDRIHRAESALGTLRKMTEADAKVRE